MRLLHSRRQKIIAAIALVAFLLIVGVFAYIVTLFAGLQSTNSNPNLPGPMISAALLNQGVLSYSNGSYEMPYVSLVYSTSNALFIYANATIYADPVPTHLYILNASNECYLCGSNSSAAVKALISGLKGYGMAGLLENTTNVSVSSLGNIQNDSILVVLNGLVPSELEANNFSLMENLLSKHTSIIYVGQNFSSMIIAGPSPAQQSTTGLPLFLYTKQPQYGYQAAGGPFVFNAPTFEFINGTQYHSATYTDAYNGVVVAFPNVLSSWPSEQDAGNDIASAVWQMFWLPRYSYGATIDGIPLLGYGSIGVIMNGTARPYNLSFPSELNSGYMRIVLEVSPYYQGKHPAYDYIETRPAIATRGTVSLPPILQPNATNVKIVFNITAQLKKPINRTYLAFYNQNFYLVNSTRGPSVHGALTSLIVHQNIGLGPGRYVIMLMNFTDNTSIAGGYFTVPAYNITIPESNFTAGTFVLYVKSGKTAIQNIAYNISMNNQYYSVGVVKSGIIEYSLPAGTPIPNELNFTIRMLHQTIQLPTYYPYRQPFAINGEYIEVGVVLIMIIIMIVFVRAPQRDEFYIDVPNLPEEKKVDIKLKADELLSVFDKLNANYHWKYMPLSKTEVKSAISVNIKYNNIPVELTYRNVDSILDNLLVNKYITQADDLYAPASWIEVSRHDIEYLATFKKLRIYFVTHSYTFSDIDISDEADIVAMLHGDKRYVVIYSQTSRFKNIPIYPQSRTHLVFLNSDAMEEFKTKLYGTSSGDAEKLKMYISADFIRLVDGDNIGKYIS